MLFLYWFGVGGGLFSVARLLFPEESAMRALSVVASRKTSTVVYYKLNSILSNTVVKVYEQCVANLDKLKRVRRWCISPNLITPPISI